MANYYGGKAVDAEVTIDFSKNELTMDYTFNHLRDIDGFSKKEVEKRGLYTPENLDDAFYNQPRLKLAKDYAIGMAVGIIFFLPVVLTTAYLSMLSDLFQTPKKYQLMFQRFFRWYAITSGGTSIKYHSGEMKDTKLTIDIGWNLWMSYELEGDYQDQIKAISLKRNFFVRKMFGKYPYITRNGWKVEFEFTNPPKHVSCKVEHL
jgi:hypothetical protein